MIKAPSLVQRRPANRFARFFTGGLREGELAASLSGLVEFTERSIPAEALARGIETWAELFGLVSLELFGHFKNTVTDPERFFAHAVESMAARVLA